MLDGFKVSIAKRVANALPPLTVEQVYQGVDYGKKGVDFTIVLPHSRLPGKVDVLAKTVVDQVRTNPNTYFRCFSCSLRCPFPVRCRSRVVPSGRLRPVSYT